MKKSLLFVAAMFAAVCANAQGTWNAVAADAAADAVVATGGQKTQVATEIQNATVYLCGASDWTVKKAGADASTFTSQGKTFSDAYAQGGTNGSDNALLYKGADESSHVEFTPTVAGKVYVAAKYGKSKKIWAAKVANSVIEAEELDMADMTPYATNVWGQYITADGGLNAEQTVTDADVYAALAYDVEPGNTYFFWVSGSKIMLCGLAFDVTGGGQTGINDAVAAKADVNAPVYNLAGQRVNANFKGIAIQNGKKFIAK